MNSQASSRIVLSALLLTTTALVSPAAAQAPIFNNQVNSTLLNSTNTGDVTASASLSGIQQISGGFGINNNVLSAGIGNTIGASATGALGVANISQSISQSTLQLGANTQPGNSVTVGDITATNNQAPTIVTPPGVQVSNTTAAVTVFGFSIIGSTVSNTNPPAFAGGGINNSISANASGAAATAGIVQSFDSNGTIDLTSLASNQIKTGDITAINKQGLIAASLNPGASATIADGMGNAIVAQASGASAGAAVNSRMLDTGNTVGVVIGPHPVVASNTVKTGDISATNRDAVGALFSGFSTGSFPTATISNGIGNSIGAIATGASASANIAQSVDFSQLGNGLTFVPSALYANTVTTGSITAFNGKNGTVTATLGNGPLGPPIADSIISYGIGNAIVAAASGASATGSIVQRLANADSQVGGGIGAGFGAANNLTTGSMSAINRGDVTANASIAAFTIGTTPLISSGMGNMIGATAVGASSGISISQSQLTSFVFGAVPDNNTAKLLGGAFARNGNGATVQANFGQDNPAQVANGVGNMIGASAIGASTGATISQSVLGPSGLAAGAPSDTTSLGSNSVIVKDNGSGHALEAVTGKTSTVIANFTQSAGFQIGTSALISNGIGNSISAQAAGAVVSASISSRFENTNVGATSTQPIATNSVKTTGGTVTDLFARNAGSVAAIFAPPSVPNGTTSNIITTGVSNFIGASAAGASASANITQSVSYDGLGGVLFASLNALPSNSVTTGDITARNTGNVFSSVTMNGQVLIGNTMFQANPPAGIGNSISAQAVGASAGASISSRFYNMSTAPNLGPVVSPLSENQVKTGDITAVNKGGGTPIAPTGAVFASATFAGVPVIGINGVANFIGASAVGASAGAGISQSVSNGGAPFAFDMTTLPANSIVAGTVTARNSGEVVASLTSGSAFMGFGVAQGSLGNIGNSISAQATGASAAASITTQVLSVAIQPSTAAPLGVSTNSVKVASLNSSNSGPVTAQANFSGALGQPLSIGGGIGNSIGASATGASSMASINQAVSTSIGSTTPPAAINSLNTLAANTINTGSINANNSGNITATLVSTGGFGMGPAGIAGGIGNSISAVAVGASAGASIVQSIANVR